MMIPKNTLLKRICPLITQIAEAHRKPRWLPVAKSKIYRIPKRPQISEEERLELLRINNNYKTQMRAIRRFYHVEMIKEKSSLESTSSELSQRVEAEEWEKCMHLNEKWNSEIAAEREQRRKVELAAMEDYALKRMESKDRELKEKIAKASVEIKLQKELSTTFITVDTLEAAIDTALSNVIDYNYAIDLNGNKLEGRETPTVIPDKKEKAVN